jgi:CheY-like chemotaxis protein
LTGNALDDDVEKFLEAGADTVYAKPFTAPQLRTILDIIDQHGSSSSEEVRDALQLATGRGKSRDSATTRAGGGSGA